MSLIILYVNAKVHSKPAKVWQAWNDWYLFQQLFVNSWYILKRRATMSDSVASLGKP